MLDRHDFDYLYDNDEEDIRCRQDWKSHDERDEILYAESIKIKKPVVREIFEGYKS